MWRLWLAIGAGGVVALGLVVWRVDATAYSRGEQARDAVWQEASRKAEAERTIERQEAEKRIAAKDQALATQEATNERETKDLRNDLDAAIAGAGSLPAVPDKLLAPLRSQSR